MQAAAIVQYSSLSKNYNLLILLIRYVNCLMHFSTYPVHINPVFSILSLFLDICKKSPDVQTEPGKCFRCSSMTSLGVTSSDNYITLPSLPRTATEWKFHLKQHPTEVNSQFIWHMSEPRDKSNQSEDAPHTPSELSHPECCDKQSKYSRPEGNCSLIDNFIECLT